MSRPSLYSSATELVLACVDCSASTLADCLCRLPRESCSAWMGRGRDQARRVRRSKAFAARGRAAHARLFKAGGARELAAVRLQAAARGILARRLASSRRSSQSAERLVALRNLSIRVCPSSKAQCKTCYSAECRADCPMLFRTLSRSRLECFGCGKAFCRLQSKCFEDRCSIYTMQLCLGNLGEVRV